MRYPPFLLFSTADFPHALAKSVKLRPQPSAKRKALVQWTKEMRGKSDWLRSISFGDPRKEALPRRHSRNGAKSYLWKRTAIGNEELKNFEF
jgi:hypothetical protein